jgi:hypothetical protein
LKTNHQAILTGIVLGLLAFQVLILVILAFFPYLPDYGLSNLNTDIYFLLSPLSTIFLLALLYAWLLRIAAKEALRYSSTARSIGRFLSEPFQKILSSARTISLSESAETFKILSRPRLLLILSLASSILLAFVPYRPDLNPTGTLVGVDSPNYITWIIQMLARPPAQALQYAFVGGLDGSRPLLLVVLYSAASLGFSLGISPVQIIEYLPMILAPLLTLSTYVFVRFGQGNASYAALTALFTPFSFYLPVGLWGGYYANMAALVLAYLFLTLLLLFSKSPSPTKYVAMFALSIALFLTHPWTWVFIATTGLVFALSLWRETRLSIHLKSIAGILIAGIALDVLKSTLFATRSVAADLATKLPTSGQASMFWVNLVDGLFYTHSGLLASWIILGVGLFACFALRFKDRFERLVLLWVATASIPFLILDSYNQTRIVYDLPIPVVMAAALLFFLPVIGNRIVRWPGMIILLVLVTCANYALQGILLL